MIKTSFNYKKFNFPCGEKHIVLDLPLKGTDITFEYHNDEELFELLLLKDTMQREGYKINKLYIPYFPYSRQDRVNQPGECLSLKVFCDLINSLGANCVTVCDPHSDVLSALVNNLKIFPQEQLVKKALKKANLKNFFLIAPDAGSLKKIYKLAKITPDSLGVVECSKQRDVLTGSITKTIVHHDNFNGIDCLIVDDICDGGRTFIEIAKILKERNAGKIYLYVTHGFFTNGFKDFVGLIDIIFTRKNTFDFKDFDDFTILGLRNALEKIL